MKQTVFLATIFLSLSAGCAAQQPDSTLRPPSFSTFTRTWYLPASLIMAGIMANGNARESFKNEIAEAWQEHLPRFRTRMDNYLQFSPIAIAYGLDACGIPSRNDITNRSVMLLKGELLMLGAVTLLKRTTHQLRPDHTAYNSFPSGHTAQAFAAATFLSEEYKYRFRWMPYASYSLASAVGLLRMANNRHYISDVLLGAGLGILSMKAAYWSHRFLWHQHKNTDPSF